MATFEISKKYQVDIISNPRHGRIILWSDTEMKKHLEKKIDEQGSFGTVYTVKGAEKDKPEYVIKKFRARDELCRKIFDNEVHTGRIAHPFINPIIARAECRASISGEHNFYFMYPYMKNGNLRHNIDREKRGDRLCTEERNSTIWIRSVYQIFQVMNYLHRPVENVRGPIFLRYLTSCSIFLDENFNVKIGDFGVAMEAELDATEVPCAETVDRRGYYPAQNIEYTASGDIFSAGVVILEILTGEKAKLIGDPKYLYQKYTCEGGDKDLITDSQKWSEENGKDRRDRLADIAIHAISSNQTMDFFLQKLNLMRLDPKERYRQPKNSDRCVSCCVNPRAQLSLNGHRCEKEVCKPFCVYCLINHHFSPLMCPEHGETRPPLSDHVYGVLVAGNNVKCLHPSSFGGNKSYTTTEVAELFIRDVEKVIDILTSKHPFVLGACKDHLEFVKPNRPGKREKMESRIITAFDNINCLIKKALEKYKHLDQKQHRLQNSLFIFYFSGHCSKDEGLYLGNENETLKASKKWIKEMLHKQLGVDQILVILDCCHADSQNFADSVGLDADSESVLAISSAERGNLSVVQLNSCDMNEKSQAGQSDHLSPDPASLFTIFLCRGWKGLDSINDKDDKIKICEYCKKQADHSRPCLKFDFQCKTDQTVTFSGLKEFIRRHLNISSTSKMSSAVHARSEKDIHLAYYDPFKCYIRIHLKCSKAADLFCFSSQYRSEKELKKDILKHAVDKNVCYDLVNLHEAQVKKAWNLIAIHSKFGREKDKELTSVNDIYQAWSIGHELEAQVRDDEKGLLHGRVKLSNIKKATSSQQEYNMEPLKISQSYIEIAIKSIKEAKEEMKRIERASSCPKDLKSLIIDILQIIQNVQNHSLLVGKEDKVLRFYLYNEFSVLAIE